MRARRAVGPDRHLRTRRGDTGASAVELAVVAPGLLLFIFVSIQAGLYYYGGVVAEQAAREGVSVLRLAQDAEVAARIDDDVQDTVESYAVAVGREALLDPVARALYAEPGDGKVTVEVTGRVISLVPGLDLTVRARVVGEVERFEGDERAR